MIHTKSIAAPMNASEDVTTRTMGMVRETPVPPAIAKIFVHSVERAGSRAVP